MTRKSFGEGSSFPSLRAMVLALTTAALAAMICAVSIHVAWAEDVDEQGAFVEEEPGLEAQSVYTSKYAIWKSDGYLHRTNESHTIDYGTVWGDSSGEARTALNGVTTLYIDYDITSIDSLPKAEYNYGSRTAYINSLPSNVKTIEFVTRSGANDLQVISEYYLFRGFTSLTTVKNLDKTQLVDIPYAMFYECTHLQSIALPSTAVSTGERAFQDCKNLSSVSLPNGITKVDNESFDRCSILKSVDLPASVTKIGSGAFRDCSSLSKVIVRSQVPPDCGWNGYDGRFYESLNSLIYVPNGSLSRYKNDWEQSSEKIRPFLEVASIADQNYTGSAVKPAVTVTWMGDSLAAQNYSVSYSNNVNPGTATATVTGKGAYSGYSTSTTFKIVKSGQSIAMHRLYNPNSGEHFYTADDGERDHLVYVGWNSEGEGWYAPEKSNTPVYRVYNSVGGEHHYTTDASEKDYLASNGWSYEGIGWYSDDAEAVPLYRDYNPNQFANNHNYTADRSEHDYLVSIGWRAEGIGWYGV